MRFCKIVAVAGCVWEVRKRGNMASRKRSRVQSDQRAYDSIFELMWMVDEQVSLSNYRS